MPEIDPELIKALDIVLEYYRDFRNEVGCDHPSTQCFIYYINNVLWYRFNMERNK